MRLTRAAGETLVGSSFYPAWNGQTKKHEKCKPSQPLFRVRFHPAGRPCDLAATPVSFNPFSSVRWVRTTPFALALWRPPNRVAAFRSRMFAHTSRTDAELPLAGFGVDLSAFSRNKFTRSEPATDSAPKRAETYTHAPEAGGRAYPGGVVLLGLGAVWRIRGNRKVVRCTFTRHARCDSGILLKNFACHKHNPGAHARTYKHE